MTDPTPTDRTRAVITINDDEPKVEFWLREGMTTAEMAVLLRTVADKFESGEARRVS